MNSSQAKSIPLTSFIERLGFVPDVNKGSANDIWYKSPFRPDEKTPSFHIKRAANVWYDFGNSKGGNIIDFVMEFQRTNDISVALNFIEQTYKSPIKKPQPVANNLQSDLFKKADESPNDTFILNEVKTNFSPSIAQYMREKRKINFDEVKEFIAQVHFSNKEGKAFFGIGMKNISNGYEVRNPFFKGSIGKKDLSFVKGVGGDKVAIFEGMFDFFSAVTYFGKKEFLQNDILILNSVSFQTQAINFLKDRPQYKTLSLFLDNDKAGQEAAANFKNAFPNKEIEPSFALYLPHNDFNEFLTSRPQAKTK